MSDDEAFVEVEDDPYVVREEPPPVQQPPSMAWLYLQYYLNNPWFILILSLLFYFYVFKRYWPKLMAWYEDFQLQRSEHQTIAEIKKNPDLYRQKMEAMELARRRQQEKYEEEAIVAAEKKKQKEEEERLRKLEDLENLVSGKGYRNKSDLRGQASGTTQDDPAQPKITRRPASLRPEYNPLMGDSGSGSGGGSSRRRQINSGG